MYFTDDDGYQIFLVYAPMSSSVTLDNSEKVTNLILTGISYEKNKQNLVLAMLSLATVRITKTAPTKSTLTFSYILLAFLLITKALLIAVSIYCYQIKL